LALECLTSVQFINLTSGPGLLILLGRGILRPGVRSAVVGVIANLVLSTIFITLFGFTGAVYGTSLALLIATVYFIVTFHRVTHYPISQLLMPYAKPIAWAASLALVARLAIPIHQLRWVGMTITAMAFAALYGTALILVGYFDAFDLRVVERFLTVPKALKRIAFVA
jgi:O-antigen/teichoic acid export membrane protein